MPEGNRTTEALPTSDQLLAAQNLVLEMIASGAPLDHVLRALASYIDQQEPAGMCSIFLLDPDGRSLRLGATFKLPQVFIRAVETLPIGPKSGAVCLGERVILPDVATDPLVEDFRDLMLEQGFHSCWSTPILSSDGSALGTVAVLYNRRHVPREREIVAVERAIQ